MMILAMINPVDMAIVVGVALVVFGPKRMPEVARQLGTFVREAKSMMSQFTESFDAFGHDVRPPVSGSDNVMRPRGSVSPAPFVPYDQRDAYAAPTLQVKSLAPEGAAADEGAPSLRLTDVSAPADSLELQSHLEFGPQNMQHDHQQFRAQDEAAQPQEANRL